MVRKLSKSHNFVAYALLAFPVIALLIYFLELRIQARFIPRVEVALQTQQFHLNGLDNAVMKHAEYLWNTPSLQEQIKTSRAKVFLPAFYVDKFEVSQQNYRRFLSWLALQDYKRYSFSHPTEPLSYIYKNPHAKHKILGRFEISASGINFYAAYAYCQATGGSLPSIEQWMAVAAGTEGRSYPWGEDFIGDPWRYSDPLLNLAAPISNRKAAATPQGVFDIANGLSEWTLNMTDDGRFIQKGGNNYNRPFMLQALNFIERPAPAEFSSKYNGFRCVYKASPNSKNPPNKQIKFTWEEQVTAILIPAGNYVQGAPENSYVPKLIAYSDRSNPNTLRSFLLVPLTNSPTAPLAFSKYEISRLEYRQFLRDPLARMGFYANKKQPKGHSYLPDNWDSQTSNISLPVVGVDWWSAYAYAKWAGGRLPSEDEWLQAFSGDAKRPYSWGNTYMPGFAHVRDRQAQIFPESPIPSKSEVKDTTPAGIVSLGGNVSEWTNSVTFYDNGINIIVKGGNYKIPGDLGTHYSYNAKVPPNHRSDVIGIRVVF
ncbi:MAG: formylglycine-generating enzyme family protein [Candidatus Portiera sp.]|nr:formylglycine-generating enzyme family protein [Portiera sp.]